MQVTASPLTAAICGATRTVARLIRKSTHSVKQRRTAREESPASSMPRGYTVLAQRSGKSADDKTTNLDATCERLALAELAQRLRACGAARFAVVTEESGVLRYGDAFEDKAIIVFLDPVDSTHMALLGYGGCSVITLTEASRDRKGDLLGDPRILAAAISTPGGETFWAEAGTEGAHVVYERERAVVTDRLTPNLDARIPTAAFSSVVYKPRRIESFYERRDWIASLADDAKVVTDHGGPLPMAKVAAGDGIDVVWDLTKGYAAGDLSPGMFIAHKAGCICEVAGGAWQPTHVPLPEDAACVEEQLLLALKKRYKFICAANRDLAEFVREHFDHKL